MVEADCAPTGDDFERKTRSLCVAVGIPAVEEVVAEVDAQDSSIRWTCDTDQLAVRRIHVAMVLVVEELVQSFGLKVGFFQIHCVRVDDVTIVFSCWCHHSTSSSRRCRCGVADLRAGL